MVLEKTTDTEQKDEIEPGEETAQDNQEDNDVPKKPKRIFVQEFCRYDFTAEEKKEFSIEMANKTLERETVEVQKKSAMASFKDQLEKLNLEIRQAATKVRDGFEMRHVDCEVVRDYENGVVRHVRTDNDEEVRCKAMSPRERQRHIDELLEKKGDDAAEDDNDIDKEVGPEPEPVALEAE